MKVLKPVQDEIAELQQRLAELKDRSRCLEQQIQQEEQQVEAEELEGSVLRNCTVAQLRDMSRTLQDLVTSENRMQISVSPPPSMLRSASHTCRKLTIFFLNQIVFFTWVFNCTSLQSEKMVTSCYRLVCAEYLITCLYNYKLHLFSEKIFKVSYQSLSFQTCVI